MPIKANKEKQILARFYDKFTGSYLIPMKDITDEIAKAMVSAMKTQGFVVTGIYDLNGSYEIKDLQDCFNLGYIMYEKRNLQKVKEGLSPVHKKLFDDVLSKKGFKSGTSYEIPISFYYKNEDIQSVVDEVLCLGMLNPNSTDGYTICMGIRDDYFVFMEAFEVGV